MTVSEAVLGRHSVRAFLDRPVDRSLVEEILDIARRAPSGGNLQPWRVDIVAGTPLLDLKARVQASLVGGPRGEGTEYPVYPTDLVDPWKDRRSKVGEQLYEAIGISRDNRPARLRQFAKNFELFGAPVGLFFSIPRSFGLPQWAHLGMFINNVMLLAVERGLGTCPQEAWAAMHRTLADLLDLPDGWMIYCGMALGYPDEAHPINGWRSEREPVDGFGMFRGF
jgi:nitroreductase